jgi:hypothetical protein
MTTRQPVNDALLVIVDFLVRHGYVSPENEPHYVDIVTRLHGRFDFTSWNAL